MSPPLLPLKCFSASHGVSSNRTSNLLTGDPANKIRSLAHLHLKKWVGRKYIKPVVDQTEAATDLLSQIFPLLLPSAAVAPSPTYEWATHCPAWCACVKILPF